MGGQVRVSQGALELPGGATVRFMRTLRLPETGTHPLPPGLGGFPLRRVADYPDRAPEQWLGHGGVLLPVYQREAMWLSFSASAPVALQVGVGKVCAVSGRPWSDRLAQDPQNYLVLPRQPWLDGINSGRGTIRQFVAVPLGLGATVEGQVSGAEVWGGVQLQVFELRTSVLARWHAEQRARAVPEREVAGWGGVGGAQPGGAPGPPAVPMAAHAPESPAAEPGGPRSPAARRTAAAMGLGAGGLMRQEVYRDVRPLDDWRRKPSGRVFVHLATAPQWREITGEPAPASPVDRAAYTAAGLPWFAYYDADADDVAAAGPLEQVRPAGDWLGDDEQPWVAPDSQQITPLGDAPGQVVDGDW
ncbi:hypothetical protein SAMN05216223_108265 [Actinacidiphila yanglinensis]|uniref:Integral membrane protein n=1 Tax=Actinacidiphila yanglinensis TaxID=310779 RepID=A0A1H6CBN7_9ACTN|nr:hypothetical protein [Actinacidiphila yanglinensis]SEG70400.1 hypothetical protein SAMN05216223_108265 [Actinacidiphila yanglinensis]